MSSVVVDLIYRIDSLPPIGSNKIAQEAMIAPGGGFNAMVAARRSGIEVEYAGAHGTGLFGDIVRVALAREGLLALQPQLPHLDQGSSVVLVDGQGERTFVSKDGADGFLNRSQLRGVSPSSQDWVLISGYSLSYPNSGEVLSAWIVDIPDDTVVVFDPSPVVEAIPPAVLNRVTRRADWITANRAEAIALTGDSEAGKIVKGLLATAGENCRGVIVRDGRNGCHLGLKNEQPVFLPGYSVATIDTNGAGDAHVGAFIAALVQGGLPVEAANYANASAALSTTHFGPSTAPTKEEVDAFLARRERKGQMAKPVSA